MDGWTDRGDDDLTDDLAADTFDAWENEFDPGVALDVKHALWHGCVWMGLLAFSLTTWAAVGYAAYSLMT